MTSSLWRFGIMLAFIGFASALPRAVGAQPPVYLTQWGSYGSGNGQFLAPVGVATDAAGDVYVADVADVGGIQKFTSTGTYLTRWGSFGSGDGQFIFPYGVATDVAGNVYVTDAGNYRIQKFTSTGTYLTEWGSLGSGNGQLSTLGGVATDAAGNIYVVDVDNDRIQKFGSAPLPMTFDLTPSTLNLASRGRWVTGFLEPASPFAAGDIDLSSIRLNGTVPVDPAAPTALGDHDGNGVPDLMVKFNRAAVELAVSGGDDVPVDVTGTVGGHSFSGTDHIRVLRAVVSTPLAGSRLTAGADARATSSSQAMVGVGEHGPDQFALRAVTPNPTQQNLRVSFGLPDAQAARIEVFNVSGRLVAAREVASLGSGFHTITLGELATLPSGIYIVRLTQGGKRLTTRAVLVR